LVFLAADCSVCKSLITKLHLRDDMTLAVVCVGRALACGRFSKSLASGIPIILDGADDIVSEFRISSFPTAVVIDRTKRIRAYGHPKSSEEIDELWLSANAGTFDLQNANSAPLGEGNV
jgi:hypothetical protein